MKEANWTEATLWQVFLGENLLKLIIKIQLDSTGHVVVSSLVLHCISSKTLILGCLLIVPSSGSVGTVFEKQWQIQPRLSLRTCGYKMPCDRDIITFLKCIQKKMYAQQNIWIWNIHEQSGWLCRKLKNIWSNRDFKTVNVVRFVHLFSE